MQKRWFFILKKLVSHAFAGSFKSAKRGEGIEFATYRDFQPGDPLRSISPAQSAKKYRYIVRLNRAEKGMICLFVVDRSASVEFGPSGISKREIQNRILNTLAPAIAQGTNQVGFLITTDKIEKYFEPKSGDKTVATRLKFISEYSPKSKLTALNTVFRKIFAQNINADLIFIISDFYNSTDFGDSLKLLARKYDVIPVLLKDKFETTDFPSVKGQMIAFKDMETDEFFWAESANKISNINLFKRLGLDYILLKTNETENDWEKKFRILFSQRRRRRIK